MWYSYYLMALGRFDEAIAEAKQAQELDPLSLIINTQMGTPFFYMREYDRAIEQYRKALEIDLSLEATRGNLKLLGATPEDWCVSPANKAALLL